MLTSPGESMKRDGRTNHEKKLTLHKETLRRLTRELTERQLANVLGGSAGDGGAMYVPTDTGCTIWTRVQ
jgi:hypothetical protein